MDTIQTEFCKSRAKYIPLHFPPNITGSTWDLPPVPTSNTSQPFPANNLRHIHFFPSPYFQTFFTTFLVFFFIKLVDKYVSHWGYIRPSYGAAAQSAILHRCQQAQTMRRHQYCCTASIMACLHRWHHHDPLARQKNAERSFSTISCTATPWIMTTFLIFLLFNQSSSPFHEQFPLHLPYSFLLRSPEDPWKLKIL